MEKKQENERKTLAAFIEIENGTPILVKRTLDEICKITKFVNKEKQKGLSKREATDPGYQYVILKKLMDEGKIGKDKKGFFVKPEHIDIAYSSMIQNEIKNLEKKGLFMYTGFAVFGIKEDWHNFPEINYLREVILDSNDIQYRMRQIKAIFLVRDFSETWKTFLELDIYSAVKYWLWKIVVSQLFSQDKTVGQKYVNEQVKLLPFLGIIDDKQIREYEDKIKKQIKEVLEKVRKLGNFGKDVLDDDIVYVFGEKIVEKLNDYDKVYGEMIKDYIANVLTNDQRKIIDNIFKWILITYPDELNDIGVYTHIGNLSYDPGQSYSHIKIPLDYEEKIFRRQERDKNVLGRIKTATENLNIETIDDSLKELFDLNDQRNYDRFHERLAMVIAHEIKEPKKIIFTAPELEKIEKEIVSLAKTEKYRYSQFISPLIDEGQSDNDIFLYILQERNPNLNPVRRYVELLKEKPNRL